MVRVTSEIGRLRQVLVHEPGPEVDVMVPSMMEELLFDDILFGESAREEHRRFRQILQLMDVDVLDMTGLLIETLQQSEARSWIVDIMEKGGHLLDTDHIDTSDANALAAALIGGVRRDPVSTVAVAGANELFSLPPIPNWCFQRDPHIVVHGGVVICSMAKVTRWREPLLSHTVFTFHPRFRDVPLYFDPCKNSVGRKPPGPQLEGGDFMIFSPEVAAVGISERTNREGVMELAESLAAVEDGPRWLLAVSLPDRRAYMHLDTVFTQVDHNAALVFPPVILGDGAEGASVYAIDLHAKSFALDPRPGCVIDALKEKGIDLEPIACGGADPVAQQREQWTDGANALAVAPGVIFIYRRNHRTADELSRKGFEVVAGEDLLMGREKIVDLEHGKRLCVLMACNELSRARGGPHCLSHALVREDL